MKHTPILLILISTIWIMSACGPQPGALSIESIPAGAAILVDDKLIGESPQEIKDLVPGPHKVELRLQDYDKTIYNLEVISGETSPYRLAVFNGTITDNFFKSVRENLADLLSSLLIKMKSEGIDKYADDINFSLPLALDKGNYDVAQILIENLIGDKEEILFDRFKEYLAKANYEPVCDFLLLNGANLNRHYKPDTTLLIEYIQKNDIKRIQYLLENNADSNYVTDSGKTPLYYALMQDNVEILKTVLFKNGDLNAIKSDYTNDVVKRVNFFLQKLTDKIYKNLANVNLDNEMNVLIDYLENVEKYDSKNKYDKDTFRRAYYWLATQYFMTKDFGESADYYLKALVYVVANTNQETDIDKLLATVKKGEWKPEDVRNAPSYYITYNIACALSRIDKLSEAYKWLRLSLRINTPILINHIKTDPDIELLRELKDKFISTVKEEYDGDFKL